MYDVRTHTHTNVYHHESWIHFPFDLSEKTRKSKHNLRQQLSSSGRKIPGNWNWIQGSQKKIWRKSIFPKLLPWHSSFFPKLPRTIARAKCFQHPIAFASFFGVLFALRFPCLNYVTELPKSGRATISKTSIQSTIAKTTNETKEKKNFPTVLKTYLKLKVHGAESSHLIEGWIWADAKGRRDVCVCAFLLPFIVIQMALLLLFSFLCWNYQPLESHMHRFDVGFCHANLMFLK